MHRVLLGGLERQPQGRVLPAPPRTKNGRRVYGPTETRILAFIRRSRELGFSLDEVRALLRLGGPEKASCREVREIAAHHLDEKISDLRKLERLLAKTVAQCTGTTAPECPVLDILDIRRAK